MPAEDKIGAEMRKASDLDPGPAIGNVDIIRTINISGVDAGTATYTEAHPTMELQFVRRHTAPADFAPTTPVWRMILQQRWGVITFNAQNHPIKRDSEWRDVPLVEKL